MSYTAEKICRILDKHISPLQRPVALHEPKFSGNELIYVKSCIDSGWVSSVGEYVDRFEKEIAEFCGSQYAIATSNGTSALHISLLLAGIEMNDEVLVPALTFVASANAVHYCGAIPHFVDSSQKDFGIDVEKLTIYMNENFAIKNEVCFNKTTGRRVSAIMAVHIFGHIGNIEGLNLLAKQYHLVVIEDASEALGSSKNGKHAGTFSAFGVISFNGNKIMTTGGGGMVLTSNLEDAQRAKHITTTAKKNHKWSYVHDEVGYNYRLPNLNAALGCAQLEQMPQFLEKKRKLAQFYGHLFEGVSEVTFFQEPANTKSNYWLNSILVNDRETRDQILFQTNNIGIHTRPIWELLSKLSMYKDCPKMDLQVAESLADRTINLPSSAHLDINEL